MALVGGPLDVDDGLAAVGSAPVEPAEEDWLTDPVEVPPGGEEEPMQPASAVARANPAA
ncbi:hypothetical protein [Lapillicoccus sp.]|uniref:hypothetical protein n=1 Tax=Lapillicoccus sp. TaxID=1909287 RepID=UPI00326361B9